MSSLEQLLSDRHMPAIDDSKISLLVTLAPDELLVTILRYAIVEAARRMAVEEDSDNRPSAELITDAVQRVIKLILESTDQQLSDG